MATRKPAAEKTHCSGTLTESGYLAWIRSALRSRWLRWQPRNDCLKAARRPYNGPNKLQKWEYECAICKKWHIAKSMEVDHYPHDAGAIRSIADIGPFVGRLYCETDNLRAVCKPCHKIHTLASSKGISMEAAGIEKKVNEVCKKEPKELLAYLLSYGYDGSSVSNATKRKALVTQIIKGEMT